MLLVQRWVGLADDAFIAGIEDRLSLRHFCGFDVSEPLPSADVLGEFRRALAAMQPDLLRDLIDRWPAPGAAAVPLISVVSPVYRAEEVVDDFINAVRRALESITSNFEIVLVEDRSGDSAWSRIAAECRADPRVKGVKLSRTFGQHQAITAGLELARGQWVVVMDCDLQDDPSFIPHLFAKTCEGYDIVLTTHSTRPWLDQECIRENVRRHLESPEDGGARGLDGGWILDAEPSRGGSVPDDRRRSSPLSRHRALARISGGSCHGRSPAATSRQELIQRDQARAPCHRWLGIVFEPPSLCLGGARILVPLPRHRGHAARRGPVFRPRTCARLAIAGGPDSRFHRIGPHFARRARHLHRQNFDQVRARPLYIVEQTLNL